MFSNQKSRDADEELIVIEKNSADENGGKQPSDYVFLMDNNLIPPDKKTSPILLDRLKIIARILQTAHECFQTSSDSQVVLSSAAEWVLDNYYLLQQTVKQIQFDLPLPYYNQLPKKSNIEEYGLPRVYCVVDRFFRSCRSYLDLECIKEMLESYQQKIPLEMGELWSLPTVLRYILLERLAFSVAKITSVEMPSWLEKYADEEKEANSWVAAGIPNLRLIDSTDWQKVFEELCIVERILNNDPGGEFAQMDFETRDRYRRVIENLAKRARISEVQVAEEAIKLAEKDMSDQVSETFTHTQLKNHVGYFLIGTGFGELLQAVGVIPTLKERVLSNLSDAKTYLYIGSILFFSFLFLGLTLAYGVYHGGNVFQLLLIVLLELIPAITLSVSIINILVTNHLSPYVLPKMDFSKCIPQKYQTFVVIPSIVIHESDAIAILKQIEMHYLSNGDRNIRFGLLTDFADAPSQHIPEDDHLLALLSTGIQELNQKYPNSSNRRLNNNDEEPFYLLHRERRWNDGEQCWMAWERKRGKLLELNQIIKGHFDTSYSIKIGDMTWLSNVHYVITLDSDTLLPQGAAKKMIATMAHPLNRAIMDDEKGKLVSGYTILQPRVQVKPTTVMKTLLTRTFAGEIGLDLYSRAVSDVYQDLFGEGIYVGKGIYDVHAFEKSITGKIPENALLSHDLFEGVLGRACLATDIHVFEDYPTHYLAYAHRMHRWVRGDWQLFPWLFSKVPSQDGTKIPNPLSTISRWKILDNLRRSLLPIATLLTLVLGWTVLPGNPLVWTGIALSVQVAPMLYGIILQFRRNVDGSYSKINGKSILSGLFRWVLNLAFLLYETTLVIDAVVATLIRIYISHKHLLRWATASHTLHLFRKQHRLGVTWKQMGWTSLFTIVLTLVIYIFNPTSIIIAFPFLISWIMSPYTATWISSIKRKNRENVSEISQTELRKIALRTWLYFSHFVGPEDHWLPPDHFQEFPLRQVAHRTSPTNIGLLLTSEIAAFEMGYIGPLDLTLRIQSTLETLDELEKQRGHLYNWYDTQNLKPLYPRYISTVDSGNLAICLLTVKECCLAFPDTSVFNWVRIQGILDALNVVYEVVLKIEKVFNSTQLGLFIDELIKKILEHKNQPDQWYRLLSYLRNEAYTELETKLLSFVEDNHKHLTQEQLSELRIWVEQFSFQLYYTQREIDNLAPWIAHFETPPCLFLDSVGNENIFAAWKNFEIVFPREICLKMLPDIFTSGLLNLKELISTIEKQAFLIPDLNSADLNEAMTWCKNLYQQLQVNENLIHAMIDNWQKISLDAEKQFNNMDFRFLFDVDRQVFHIGYNVETEKLDSNYYDLFASEARIASLIAIAKGDVPDSHWLHLSRPFTNVDGVTALLSWSATMFEYLMPSLFLRTEEDTLTGQTAEAAIKLQIAYTKNKKIPWGISESAYYHFDSQQNYQYQAFGVPGLGLKRGLEEDMVISPYSSLIALEFNPHDVMRNLEFLNSFGAKGIYGYYDAIDFTPGRVQSPNGEIVRTFMAHHQGMILLSLSNFLNHEVIKNRLRDDPRLYSINLFLYETTPQNIPFIVPHLSRESRSFEETNESTALERWEYPVETPVPQVHVLSNGNYTVMITNAGTGYSQWQGVDLTRWKPDTTLDNCGTFIYVRDLDRGKNWSAMYQPIPGAHDQFLAQFELHKAEFVRRVDDIAVETEISISPDDPVEIRKIQITNHSNQKRTLQIFSYGEVILSSQMADRRHPAFNKLFIDSEYDSELDALIYHRRPRSLEDQSIYLGHCLASANHNPKEICILTDREKWIGRGQNNQNPDLLDFKRKEVLKEFEPTSAINQLDPIFCIGVQVELKPHTTYNFAYLTIAADSGQQVRDLIRKYQKWNRIENTIIQSSILTKQKFTQLNFTPEDIRQYHQLLSLLLYPHHSLRASPSVLASNTLGQSSLWQYAVSGDYPILLVHVESEEDISTLTELVNSHGYFRGINQIIDLVILNDHDLGYNQEMQNLIFRLINRLGGGKYFNQRGGIFLLRSELIPIEQRILFETCARVIIKPNSGTLNDQLAKMFEQPIELPAFSPAIQIKEEKNELQSFTPDQLNFYNGLGGFSNDGKEYRIILEEGKNTPVPWINVIANEQFGYWISESGMGTTWSENSGENKITTWNNDPLMDNQGEAIYLRDEETGRVWSPTPLPCRADSTYFIRHGLGYSVFENSNQGIITTLTFSIAKDEPVKFALLRIQNISNRIRRISATYYAEWVLGTDRDQMRPYIIPEFDTTTHALLARNPYNTDFQKQVAFLTATRAPHGVTGSRVEFLGRNGNFKMPAALKRVGLASTIEPGTDPCAAFQQLLWLAPGEVKEVTFLLGCGKSRKETDDLIRKYQDFQNVQNEIQRTRQFWDEQSSVIQVKTPEPSLDLMINRWLPYQVLACRTWGRSALYQSSGAFGFRDQLQDVLALLYSKPEFARSHILEAAKRQFAEGDVLHWWHPPYNRGVRSRCSDDLLWLPYSVCSYIKATGDLTILDEKIPFLYANALRTEEIERYDNYFSSEENGATLFEHCRLAIERGCTKGKHGLPLIGSHDWNDGMNQVGVQGKGESVWMGWFLIDVLERFSELCNKTNRHQLAGLYQKRIENYKKALNSDAWDGHWYLRAFFDNGQPMGSKNNSECKIDAIAQSWAVISGAADNQYKVSAMNAVWSELVNEEEGIVLLFTPSFNHSDQNPGYIKGYKPGVRENGGQYSHASVWTGWAFAEMGDAERALKVFRMISPISHSDKFEKMTHYRVEPYVVAADIYGEPPFTGRGGWTWYTGSAGWLYRFGLEKILGFKKEGEYLSINPIIPPDWNGFQIDYRYGVSQYSISVIVNSTSSTPNTRMLIDGIACDDKKIHLLDDGKTHHVQIIME